MALDPRLAQQNIQNLLQANQPIQNLLGGVQLGQQLAGEQQRQNLLAQQAQRAEVLAPLQQQLLGQQIQSSQLGIEQAEAQNKAFEQEQAAKAFSSSMDVIKPFVDAGDIDGALGSLESLREIGADDDDIAKFTKLLTTGDLNTVQTNVGKIDSAVKTKLGVTPAPRFTGVEVDTDSGQVIYTNKSTGETVVEQVNGASKSGGLGVSQLNTLVSDLTPDMQEKAKAAYNLAGGGKDGVKAINKFIEKGGEAKKRADVPNIIASAYPNATPEELRQIQATVDAGKTVESGLKEAAKVREEQRRNKKAKSFRDRAVGLMTSILNNDQLGDVLGSIEGSYSFRFSDAESELIQDIEEAQNILTADNMDLMTGVLSESDIALLKNLSSGGLSRKRSEPRFRRDVQSIINKLSGANIPVADDGQDILVLPNGVSVKRISGGVRG